MRRAGSRRVVLVAALAAGLATGCARERRLFDVILDVQEAEALLGVLDRDDVVVLHEVIPDVGAGNGGDGREQTIALALDPAATSAIFTLTVADVSDLTAIGVGRSLATPLPSTPATLTVPLLLVPGDAPGALTALPPAPGPDACVTDDGLGATFIAGGGRSQQGAYLIDEAVQVRTIAGADFPAGVQGPGCGATEGVLAVVGGCGGDVDATAIHRIDGDGARVELVTTAIGVPCGATAAPRRDGRAWLLDGDHTLHLVSTTTTTDLGTLGTTSRTGFEVNGDDAAIALVDGDVFYAADAVTNLGAHLALGRRGPDVLVLDNAGLVSLVENATTVALFDGVPFADVRSFVVLLDGTFVGLRQDGGTLDVRLPDGTTRTVPTTAPGSTRIAARQDGVVVIGGADVDGLLAVGLVR